MVGTVQEAQGDLAGALKSYNDGLAIFERLAKAHPGNAGWQRDLAMSFARLALAHKQSGDRAKARDFFRQGQVIMARLTKLSPDNAEWKQVLAEFDRQIAELDRDTADVRHRRAERNANEQPTITSPTSPPAAAPAPLEQDDV